MKKVQPLMTIDVFKSNKLNETHNFGNGWGLFIEIDILDTTPASKYKYGENTLKSIIEEDDIEKNLAGCIYEDDNKKVERREIYYITSYKITGCISTLLIVSIITYIIIYVI